MQARPLRLLPLSEIPVGTSLACLARHHTTGWPDHHQWHSLPDVTAFVVLIVLRPRRQSVQPKQVRQQCSCPRDHFQLSAVQILLLQCAREELQTGCFSYKNKQRLQKGVIKNGSNSSTFFIQFEVKILSSLPGVACHNKIHVIEHNTQLITP